MKKYLVIFLTLFFFLLPTPSAFAGDKFKSTVNVTYAVAESGITQTTIHTIITNTTPNFYVSSYTLKLGFAHIDNLKAYDSGGPIIPVIQKTDTGQDVTLQLNKSVYGVNTTLPFTLSFDTPDIATQNGSIWEVNIPGLASQNEFSDFTVTVTVPPSFGKPTYIKPQQPSDSLTFTKDQLGKSGISLAFGKTQTYAFHLSYHLANNILFPQQEEIALPPSTNYQDVYITSLSPKPIQVKKDVDGNWIAEYMVAPSENIRVLADGIVSVNLYPKSSILSKEEWNLFTREQSFWQQNTAIKTLAKQLRTPEAIYDYVVGHLHYDFSRVNSTQERLGAAAVLDKPTSAVCLEFSDLFVAIARAADIPAREIDGYAYTQNTKERPLSLIKDVLHAWPEYYDNNKKQWIMVDPTWGNTTGGVDYFNTFDFDHITFAIKGANSSSPIPAGGYKLLGDEKSKDISVTFATLPDSITPLIQASLAIPATFLAGFPISGSILLKNTGAALFPQQTIHVVSHGLTPHDQLLTFPDIPPFGNETIPVSFNKTPFLTNTHAAITIALVGQEISQEISVVPFSVIQLVIGGIILAILGFTLFTIARRSRRLSIS